MQTKQELEKLYTKSENIEGKRFVQTPIYDNFGHGFFLGQSTKKYFERKGHDLVKVKKDLKISKSSDTSKEKENSTHSKKSK